MGFRQFWRAAREKRHQRHGDDERIYGFGEPTSHTLQRDFGERLAKGEYRAGAWERPGAAQSEDRRVMGEERPGEFASSGEKPGREGR